MPSVQEEVMRITVDVLGVDESQVGEVTAFVADLGVDGLDAEKLAEAFEAALGVGGDALQEKILTGTVGDVIRYIASQMPPDR